VAKRIRLGPKDQLKLQELALRSRRGRVLLREKPAAVDARTALRNKKALAKYEKHVEHVYQDVLESVLRAVATAQAVSDVNAALENAFGMSGVSVDAGRVQASALEVLQVEIAESLTRRSTASAKSRRELVSRIVARLVPTRDGAPSPTSHPVKVPTRDDRVADLERVISREVKRSFPPPKRVTETRVRIDE
jgi:DNA polymerase III gamma/tau subunit